MKRGDKFLHAFWLDANNQPLRCEITSIRRGRVHWKRENGTYHAMWFDADAASKHVKEWLQ